MLRRAGGIVVTTSYHVMPFTVSLRQVSDDTSANRSKDNDSDNTVSSSRSSPSSSSTASSSPPPMDESKRATYRELLISEILSRDKEIFELKRQHELSMLRVEQNQRRVLKDQEDRGMYYEQNCNVHTFDTVSLGLYTQRNTLYHTMDAERLRNAKFFATVIVTIATCFYLYYRYMINDDWVYVEKPMRILGSRVGELRELRIKLAQEKEDHAAL